MLDSVAVVHATESIPVAIRSTPGRDWIDVAQVVASLVIGPFIAIVSSWIGAKAGASFASEAAVRQQVASFNEERRRRQEEETTHKRALLNRARNKLSTIHLVLRQLLSTGVSRTEFIALMTQLRRLIDDYRLHPTELIEAGLETQQHSGDKWMAALELSVLVFHARHEECVRERDMTLMNPSSGRAPSNVWNDYNAAVDKIRAEIIPTLTKGNTQIDDLVKELWSDEVDTLLTKAAALSGSGKTAATTSASGAQ